MKFDSVAKVRCDYAIETFQKTNGFQSQRKTCGCPLFTGEKKIKKNFAIKYRSTQSHHLIAKAGKTTLLSTLKHNLKPTQQRAVSYPNPCIWKSCEGRR